ncbi:lipopolysaccharide biosynthesis protein [Priestia megaterium]
MRHYIDRMVSDNMLKRLLKNAGILLSGNILATMLALLSLGITARSLGPHLFGVLVLIETFILVVDGIVNLQSFQSLIKYGSDFLERKQRESYKSLIKFGFILDSITAFIGTCIAIIVVYFFSDLLNIQESVKPLVCFYSLVILLHITGTPTAILRSFNKFNVLAWKNVIQSFIKLIGVTVVYIMDGSLTSFIVVWIISDVVSSLYLIIKGVRCLENNGYKQFYKAKLSVISGKRKGIVTFILSTNVNSTIRMLSRQFDVLIIGAVLGAASSGLYKVAKQFSSILSKVSDPLYQAIYPQLTKLVITNDYKRIKQLSVKSGLIVGLVSLSIWICFLMFGPTFISLAVGKEFLAMDNLLLIYMLAIVLSVITFPFQPLMLAFGKPNLSLIIQVICTLVYFSSLYPLLKIIGIEGAGLAYLIYYSLWCIFMGCFLYKDISKGIEQQLENEGYSS